MTSEDEDTEGQKDSVTCLAFSGKLVHQPHETVPYDCGLSMILCVCTVSRYLVMG